ncbi:MAG: hypothetical protein J6039_01300 [Alphaproteobacteria bacterium]|nr:hypothetical protein [Alphaproteobacteria bacterium]
MKKFFCFYCQNYVSPFKFFKWRFCPHCKRFMQDNGEGFYRVCDKCGANLPADATKCLKCGYHFGNTENQISKIGVKGLAGWQQWLVNAVFLFVSIVLGVFVLYISFYAFAFFVLVGLICFIFVFLSSFFYNE